MGDWAVQGENLPRADLIIDPLQPTIALSLERTDIIDVIATKRRSIIRDAIAPMKPQKDFNALRVRLEVE